MTNKALSLTKEFFSDPETKSRLYHGIENALAVIVINKVMPGSSNTARVLTYTNIKLSSWIIRHRNDIAVFVSDFIEYREDRKHEEDDLEAFSRLREAVERDDQYRGADGSNDAEPVLIGDSLHDVVEGIKATAAVSGDQVPRSGTGWIEGKGPYGQPAPGPYTKTLD